MNRLSHRSRSWSWLMLALFCCGLFFIGGVLSRATAQENLNFEAPVATTPQVIVQATMPSAAPEFLPKLTPNEQRILKALDDASEVAFTDTPLEEALKYLEDLHSIEIWLDKEALTASGVNTDQPLTLQISGVSLQSALRLLLEPLALTSVIESEVLKITTQAVADKNVITRTYPVSDLFSTREEAEELIESLVCGLGLTQKSKEGPKPLVASIPSSAIIARLSRPQNDQLLQLLRDLREAKSLAPIRPALMLEPNRAETPASDNALRPTLDPNSGTSRPTLRPGLSPDDFNPRPSVRPTVPTPDDVFVPFRETPPTVKPAIKKQS